MAPTSGFFQSNIIFIFFAYGLAFCLMGVVIAVESRRTSALNLARSLWLLGGFGLLNGVVGWIDMFMAMPRPTAGPDTSLISHVIQPLNCFDCHQRLGAVSTLGWEARQVQDLLKLFFLIAAPTALLLFGAKLLHDTRESRWRLLRWMPLALLGLFSASFLLGRDLSGEGIQDRLVTAGILARYTLYLPGSTLAAAALLAQRKPFHALGLPRIAGDITWAAALFGLLGLLDGLVVPPAPFVPASLVNYASFFAITGVPVQGFRAVVAVIIAYFVVRSLRIFEIEYRRRLSTSDEERFQAQQQVLAGQQRAKDQLEKWNQELEQRVLQRTREVEQRNREVAILEERERLAGEMHDTLGQVLAYVNLKVLTATQTLSSGMTDKALGELKDMEKAVTGACADVRESILSLKTTVDEKRGLLATLPDFLDRYSEQTGLKVELSTGGLEDTRFALETEIQLLRIVQEALANVRKHARATRAWLNITGSPKEITFVVRDDGQGFDPASIQQNPGNRFGLQIMKERAERTGGRLEVASSPGHGTRVVINVPRAALEGE